MGAFGVVAPETWCERHGFVACWGEFLYELVESNDGGFFEAAHTASDFKAHVSVVGDFNVVLGIVPDFLGNDIGANAHVLEVFHWGAKEKVFHVDTEVPGAVFGIGDCAVDV
jgi:hypothetical protein